MVGVKHSPEVVEKNRARNLGKILTPEHRAAISAGLKGGKMPDSHRAATSARMKILLYLSNAQKA